MAVHPNIAPAPAPVIPGTTPPVPSASVAPVPTGTVGATPPAVSQPGVGTHLKSAASTFGEQIGWEGMGKEVRVAKEQWRSLRNRLERTRSSVDGAATRAQVEPAAGTPRTAEAFQAAIEPVDLSDEETAVLGRRFAKVEAFADRRAISSVGAMTNDELDNSLIALGYGNTARSVDPTIMAVDAAAYMQSQRANSAMLPAKARSEFRRAVDSYQQTLNAASTPEEKKAAFDSIPVDMRPLFTGTSVSGPQRILPQPPRKIGAVLHPRTPEEKAQRMRVVKAAAIAGAVAVGAVIAYKNRERIGAFAQEHIDTANLKRVATEKAQQARMASAQMTASARKKIRSLDTKTAKAQAGRLYEKAKVVGRRGVAGAWAAKQAIQAVQTPERPSALAPNRPKKNTESKGKLITRDKTAQTVRRARAKAQAVRTTVRSKLPSKKTKS